MGIRNYVKGINKTNFKEKIEKLKKGEFKGRSVVTGKGLKGKMSFETFKEKMQAHRISPREIKAKLKNKAGSHKAEQGKGLEEIYNQLPKTDNAFTESKRPLFLETITKLGKDSDEIQKRVIKWSKNFEEKMQKSPNMETLNNQILELRALLDSLKPKVEVEKEKGKGRKMGKMPDSEFFPLALPYVSNKILAFAHAFNESDRDPKLLRNGVGEILVAMDQVYKACCEE